MNLFFLGYFFCIWNFINIQCEEIKKFKHPIEACQIAKKYLPANPVILEAGCYDATDTLLMKSFWPNSKIHAFEPVEQLFLKAQAKLKSKTGIHLYNVALSDVSGKSIFYLSYDSAIETIITQSSSLLQAKEHYTYAPYTHFKASEVACLTLDDWAKKYQINNIDFMWLDLQGYELNVLMKSKIIVPTVKAILLEVEFVEAYKSQYMYDDILQWFKLNNFELIAASFDPTNHDWYGDVLFIRE